MMKPSLCRARHESRLNLSSRRLAKSCPPERARTFTSAPFRSGRLLVPAAAFIITGASAIWWFISWPDQVPCLAQSAPIEDISKCSISEEEVTAALCEEAYSFRPRRESGVERYDGTQVASNTPCEDRFVHGQLQSLAGSRTPWSAWGIFDGHSGWQTAELLSKQLVPFVRSKLENLHELSENQVNVQHAITKGFVDLDRAIMNTALEVAHSQVPLQEKIKTLAPAYAGSCALLALFNPKDRNLYVACTGDARAVLGRKSADGKWEAIPLSVDQNGSNAVEVLRLQEEHPGEVDLVKNGRVLGLMTSRAFGDGQWKFPASVLSEFAKLYRTPGPLTPRYPVATPPYITAQPVVTTTKLSSTRSFLILASDGLWFSMSDQDAVDVVGHWLDRGIAKTKPSSMHDGLNFASNDVPWRYAEECFTVEDSNAAVHLVRNALGGRNRELVAARLAFWPPRRIRDDITVQVVFFNPS